MATGSQGPGGLDSGRERISRAAYELFSRHGTQRVGIDAVIAKAGAAKMTLYRNFASKDDLILDFLQRRERIWTREWLQVCAVAGGSNPQQRLLAIFDVFGKWFGSAEFDGCAFLTTMLEVKDPLSPVRQASVEYLANIRDFIIVLAAEAGIDDAEAFARQWHILMKGSIMAAHEGDLAAAGRARAMGVLLLRSHGIEAD